MFGVHCLRLVQIIHCAEDGSTMLSGSAQAEVPKGIVRNRCARYLLCNIGRIGFFSDIPIPESLAVAPRSNREEPLMNCKRVVFLGCTLLVVILIRASLCARVQASVPMMSLKP